MVYGDGVSAGTYSNLHALLSNRFQAAHDVLLHLYELRELLGEVRPEGAGSVPSESMAYIASVSVLHSTLRALSA